MYRTLAYIPLTTVKELLESIEEAIGDADPDEVRIIYNEYDNDLQLYTEIKEPECPAQDQECL